MKFLIFIVSYNAANHITKVLERIPKDMLDDDNVDLLIIDDASSDAGARLAREWLSARSKSRALVLRNPVNQGYGGNQKLGYRYAVEHGYDYVILLHGDGQYAPELLPKFREICTNTSPDVVLGSRMVSKASALKGGMPLYKLIGNICLTKFQNFVLGQNISEYHTGYRAYSTKFLRAVSFEFNTNDFHFDTEIILQAINVGGKITEFPIPTHYGDEVCHVDGLAYAKYVVSATLSYKTHTFGIFSSLKYARKTPKRYESKLAIPLSSHTTALNALSQAGTQRVLDVGCGPGHLAIALQQAGKTVTAIDREDSDPKLADFRKVDIESSTFPVNTGSYDAVVLLDVIEHLTQPERFLLNLVNQPTANSERKKEPLYVISTANVAFILMRFNLLLGRFRYGERGILDFNHKRLFTKDTLLTMLTDLRFDIVAVHATVPPFSLIFSGRLSRAISRVWQVAANKWPALFAYQFVVECRPRPSVSKLLNDALHSVATTDDRTNKAA